MQFDIFTMLIVSTKVFIINGSGVNSFVKEMNLFVLDGNIGNLN